jgi:hypothetical protein
MFALKRYGYRLILLAWASYTALAQPGIPACWLERHACEIHIHLSQRQAESPHTHGYLFDLANADGAATLPSLFIPLSILFLLIFDTLIMRGFTRQLTGESRWISRLEPPPPRTLLPL